MTTDDRPLRKQLFKDQSLGEHARDTQQALSTQPFKVRKTVEGYYQLGMQLGSPIPNRQPESITLQRIVNALREETAVGCSGLVDYAWKPLNGGAVVLGIYGLTPSTTVKYRMVFEFTYPAIGTT